MSLSQFPGNKWSLVLVSLLLSCFLTTTCLFPAPLFAQVPSEQCLSAGGCPVSPGMPSVFAAPSDGQAPSPQPIAAQPSQTAPCHQEAFVPDGISPMMQHRRRGRGNNTNAGLFQSLMQLLQQLLQFIQQLLGGNGGSSQLPTNTTTNATAPVVPPTTAQAPSQGALPPAPTTANPLPTGGAPAPTTGQPPCPAISSANPQGQTTPPQNAQPSTSQPQVTGPATGQFTVSGTQIIDPDGKPFIAKGINLLYAMQTDANTVLTTFPGTNMVRIATIPGQYDQSAMDTFVATMQSKKVVVEIEHHTIGQVLTGQALTDENSWYTSLATKYKGNPYVWFGTMNEPDGDHTALVQQEVATYNAIRGTGNNTILMLELRGGSYADASQENASLYQNLNNVVWDFHFYGWVPNYSTDQNTVTSAFQQWTQKVLAVRSLPIIVGEYGASTTGLGNNYDANWMQVMNTVQGSGDGSLAWCFAVGAGNLGDALTDNGALTQYGQEVANFLKQYLAFIKRHTHGQLITSSKRAARSR